MLVGCAVQSANERSVRNFLHENRFTEIETPILTEATPEGSRDFVVPARLQPGAFYALPQSPQQYKQLLMVGGIDKYFQIAPCFRDEDPRADRHSCEFYQVDCEMSFVEQEDVYTVVESYMKQLITQMTPHKNITVNFTRLSYADAEKYYGSDKPDLRFGCKFVELEKKYLNDGVDVIVGFPGETEEDFEETYLFLNELDVSYLHVFTYSERAKTTAIKMDNPVPMNIRKERSKRLRILSAKKKREFYKINEQKTEEVIFEAEHEHGIMHGFTSNYVKVKAPFNPLIKNHVVPVKMTEVDRDGIMKVEFIEKRVITESFVEVSTKTL